MHASNICYLNKDYKQALAHYSTIEKIVVSQENMNTSIIGQMRCFWFLQNYQSTIEYCNYTLKIETSDNNIKSEALLYKGLSLKYLEQYDSAFVVLKTASELNKSKRAANAKYNMCEILYIQKKYELCEAEIMQLVKQKPSYDYYLAKAIILLGDNFVALEDYFNAKHSLKSIIDNYSGKDKAELVKIAQDKIDKILVIENPTKEIKNEEVEIDFNNIDPSDADLFETETQINEEESIDTEINKDENTDENEK
jgi:tetratricopeptide (TPR) repeat protein